MNERILTSIGFYEHQNQFTGQKVWAWGKYTENADKMCKNLNLPLKTNGAIVHIPIIEFDIVTKQAYAAPINYKKTITTLNGLEKFMESTNFLMSTES